MALSATIFKAELTLCDMNRDHYESYALTLARHPSETDERMMVRLLAYALHANEALHFTKGLCVDEEPDLWQKDLTGEIALWIDVGLPDERRVRKACNRSKRVVLFPYGDRNVDLWWQRNAPHWQRFTNLTVLAVSQEAVTGMAAVVQRHMTLQYTIQDEDIWLNCGEAAIHLSPRHLSLP